MCAKSTDKLNMDTKVVLVNTTRRQHGDDTLFDNYYKQLKRSISERAEINLPNLLDVQIIDMAQGDDGTDIPFEAASDAL